MTDLPTLADRRIDEIEDSLFEAIAHERDETRRRDAVAADARRRKRRTWWGASGAAAAVLVVAVAIAPQLSGLGGSAGSAAPAVDQQWSFGAESADRATEGGSVTSEGFVPAAPNVAAGGEADDLAGAREVVATASASVVVDDTAVAADHIGGAAEAVGGYVESLSLGRSAGVPDAGVSSDMEIWPPVSGGAWISVRVPAAELTGVIDGLQDVGDVTSSRITRDDVTTQTVDLRARVAAAQVSVERLSALLGEAGSLSDLIAAESALAERQAELESLQQQLTAVESQIELSSLTVELTTTAAPVDADPAGFGDGLAAGWNGLVATLNGVIVALGFLLPWLVVLGGAALLVWLVVATTRRRRARQEAVREEMPVDESEND